MYKALHPEGQTHAVDPEAIAPVLAEFFASPSR
jgi:hypothetical protein